MADPITGALIVAGAFKAITSLISGNENADAIRKQNHFNRQMASINIELIENQREDVKFEGAREQGRVRQAAQRLQGAQAAAFAAQGVDVGSGSAALIQADTQYLAEIDALEVKNNARKAAFGFDVKRRQTILEARFGGQAAENAARQSIITGGLNAISAAANTVTSVNTYQNTLQPKVAK